MQAKDPNNAPSFAGPLAVDLDVTFACNMRCLHCNVAGGEKAADEFSTAEVISLINECHELGVGFLSITGGEPLLRPDWRTILEHATSFDDWRVLLNTNGTVLSQSDIESAMHVWPKLDVVVSLDGHSPATYATLRRDALGPADQRLFHKAVSFIEEMKRMQAKRLLVNFTLTSLTLDHFIPTCSFASELDVDGILGIKFFLGGRGYDFRDDLEIPFPDWKEFILKLSHRKSRGAFPTDVQLLCSCPWEIYVPLLEGGLTREDIETIWMYSSPFGAPSYDQSSDVGCTAGKTFCAIAANGFVHPCGTLSREKGLYPCGNVRDGGLTAVWNNSPALRKLRNLTMRDLPKECAACSYREVCGGGCRGRALTFTGKINGPDSACPILSGES